MGWTARFEPRDLWVGLFWDKREDGLHVYVCLLPTIVLHGITRVAFVMGALVVEILLVVLLWFIKASGIAPDMSWLVVLAPIWVPYAMVFLFAWMASWLPGKGKSRSRSKSR